MFWSKGHQTHIIRALWWKLCKVLVCIKFVKWHINNRRKLKKESGEMRRKKPITWIMKHCKTKHQNLQKQICPTIYHKHRKCKTKFQWLVSFMWLTEKIHWTYVTRWKFWEKNFYYKYMKVRSTEGLLKWKTTLV